MSHLKNFLIEQKFYGAEFENLFISPELSENYTQTDVRHTDMHTQTDSGNQIIV